LRNQKLSKKAWFLQKHSDLWHNSINKVKSGLCSRKGVRLTVTSKRQLASMVNSRPYKTVRPLFSCASLKPFQFLNCKTELLQFSKWEPKTFWDTKIEPETFRSVLGNWRLTCFSKISNCVIAIGWCYLYTPKLRDLFHSLLNVKTLGNSRKRSRSWDGQVGKNQDSKTVLPKNWRLRDAKNHSKNETARRLRFSWNLARP